MRAGPRVGGDGQGGVGQPGSQSGQRRRLQAETDGVGLQAAGQGRGEVRGQAVAAAEPAFGEQKTGGPSVVVAPDRDLEPQLVGLDQIFGQGFGAPGETRRKQVDRPEQNRRAFRSRHPPRRRRCVGQTAQDGDGQGGERAGETGAHVWQPSHRKVERPFWTIRRTTPLQPRAEQGSPARP